MIDKEIFEYTNFKNTRLPFISINNQSFHGDPILEDFLEEMCKRYVTLPSLCV